MQPLKYLKAWLQENSSEERFLFSLQDLRLLLPTLSLSTFKTLLSRAVQAGHLIRVCRGIYTSQGDHLSNGLLLFHVAAHLRANDFNYISLETALSDAGIISQVPMNWITLMSSGRSHKVSCGKFGTIEFVHTTQRPGDIGEELTYDGRCRLWRASNQLALRDMKRTHRNCDLIDWDVANESI